MRLGTARRAFTLLEVIVSISVFSIALVVLGVALSSSKAALVETTGSSDAAQSLRKLYLSLEQGIHQTSFETSDSTTSLTAPGGGLSGDAIWFLSAADPATGAVDRAEDGTPRWLRNVLYYPAVPTNHTALYGTSCAGGVDVDGYDVFCPHKVLIRKVIDYGSATTYQGSGPEEGLIPAADINQYLTAPTGFSVGVDTSKGEEESRVLVPRLLTFRAWRAPAALAEEIGFLARCTSIQELGKATRVGSVSLETAPQTESMEFSIFPQN